MIQELDNVVLAVDLPDYGLVQGDVGTVVLVHGSEGYEVEFITLDGNTIAVVSLASDQVRSIGEGEIPHARPMSSVSTGIEKSFGTNKALRSREDINTQPRVGAGTPS